MLATACEETGSTWLGQLSRTLVIYNHTKHSQTGHAPADFFMGEAVNIPLPLCSPYWRPPGKTFKQYKIGQLVLRKIPALTSHHKLSARYDGPYTIIKVDPNLITYKLKALNRRKESVAHYNQLKLWDGDSTARGVSQMEPPAGEKYNRQELELQAAFAPTRGASVDP
jgi:hypothetical protein